MRKIRRASSRASSAQKKGIGPILLIGGGVLILLVVVIWQLSLLPSTTVAQSGNFDIPYPEIQRVSLADAKSAFDSGEALILDVRDSGTYASLHIAGSSNIPLTELETRANELPKDRWIITVCT